MSQMTVQEAIAKIGSLESEVKALKDSAGSEAENKQKMERMAADLRDTNQALAELRAAQGSGYQREGAAHYNKFIVDGDRKVSHAREVKGAIRMVGGYNGATKCYEPGLLDGDKPNDDWQGELYDLVDQRSMLRTLLKNPQDPSYVPDTRSLDARLVNHLRSGPAQIAKIFADGANIGAEFIPDVTMPRLVSELETARRTAGLFPLMQMSQKTVKLPWLGYGGTPKIKGVPSGNDPSKYTASSPATDERSFTAVPLAVRYQLDEDAVDDSIIPALPMFRADIVKAIINGEEDALFNADTGTHQDTGLASWNPRSLWDSMLIDGGSDDHRRQYIGMRARAGDVSATVDLGTFNIANVRSMRSTMDAPHGTAGDLVLFVSPEAYLKLVGLDEVTTVDKYGSSATIVTGELARIDGIPIVQSDLLTADLNASGVYDGVTTTKTSMVLVNTSRFLLGVRKGRTVEIGKDIRSGVYNLVATYRSIFGTIDSSTKKNVVHAYNIA